MMLRSVLAASVLGSASALTGCADKTKDNYDSFFDDLSSDSYTSVCYDAPTFYCPDSKASNYDASEYHTPATDGKIALFAALP